MDQFVQLTVTGLANGAILALAALGFVLIYKASGVINFAQGEFLLIGAYVIYAVIAQVGLHYSAGIAAAVVVAIALGVAVERLILRPLVGQPTISVIMVTIGLAQLLRSVIQIFFGTNPRSFPEFIPGGTLDVAGATVPVDRLWGIGLAALTLAAFTVFFQRSRDGIAMRAVADDQQAALTMGISVRRVFALSWALAGISAVIGGMLVANITGVSGAITGFGLTVFPVVILGGLDSIAGAMIGGAVIGLLTTYTGGYIGGGLQTVVPYLALVLILLVRPYGLFGQVRIERV
ncbi:MAG: branched-chain amino acid ABC transporter permease [Euzebyales bacterium]|nr:branched-chain amino acid ABC transporter permease [Euzebyales bacterium]MBA3621736.1 branched-chain amino acid ABC transporter permease [Euzebyales bacterium]